MHQYKGMRETCLDVGAGFFIRSKVSGQDRLKAQHALHIQMWDTSKAGGSTCGAI